MKKLCALLITLIIVSGLTAQSCLPDGITFTTQAQIDSFQINYPGCTEILGDVDIDGVDNLYGLSVISEIGGNVRIWTCGISNLTGLNNLNTIGGSIEIYENYSLNTLTGLENLVSIGGNMHIGYWEFDMGNYVLHSISALQNLTSIGGVLEIANNPLLTSLSGLENLDASTITELYIFNNSSLPSCNVQSVCDFLNSPNGSINIYNNASGCNNPVEVTNACGLSFECLPYGNYWFVTQDEIDNFQINYPGCYDLNGNVTLTGGSAISNLNGLGLISSIEGGLHIYNNNNLTDLSGLEGLNHIGANLSIGGYVEGGNSFVNLNGLENLDSIGGDFSITHNPMLESFSGLDGLTYVGGWFWIGVSSSLTSISALGNLNFIGRGCLIGGDYPQNSTLTSLSGLNGLTTINDYLWIEGMNALKNLNGLESLSSIGGFLKISKNDSLIDLKGIENISPATIESLDIYSNNSLSNCEVQSICEYLATPGANVYINDNAPGCNSPAEVQDSCVANAVNIDDQFFVYKLSVYPNPTNSIITIELTNHHTNQVDLTISNTKGQQLITQPINKPQIEIDISHLPAGIYFVKVCAKNIIIVQKLVKQ